MKAREALNETFEQLCESDIFYGHGLADAWEESVALICHLLDVPVDSDDSCLEIDLTQEQVRHWQGLLARRVEERVPMAYLIQQMWFMGLPFFVDERVLIPRSPFAEWIDRQFAPWVNPQQVQHILEIGTGSGCLAIATAVVFPKAHVDAVDISEAALQVATVNVAQHNVADRVTLYQSDCFSGLPAGSRYDLIISNPPYVSQEEVASLPPEYTHEPTKTALYAADDGFAIVDRILLESVNYMTDSAILIVEVGYSDEAFMARYPDLPVTWLECEFGGQGLFMLTKQQLEQYHVGK